ncbi:MAG: MFS transporter [Actinomycetes bacterium]
MPSAERPNAWIGAAAALLVVGWGANQFSPMLLVYRAQDHFGLTTVDALFGVYAVGLIPALLVGGPLSDRHGRRMVIPVVGLSAVASVVVMVGASSGLPALYTGRFLAGVASGLAFAPGTAWVKELTVGAGGAPESGARRAAVWLSAGFGLGPLVAGLLAQWAPGPEVLPYAAHLVIVAAVAPLVWATPETVTGFRGVGPPRRPGLRRSGALDRRFVRVAALMAPWVFAAPSVSFAVLPAQVARRTGHDAVAFAAVIAGLTLAVGVLVQPYARRLEARSAASGTQVGLVAVVVGLLLGAGASASSQPVLVGAAAVCLGAGYGSCLVSGLLEVQRIAPPSALGGLTAVYSALTYLGFSAPIVLAAASGLATDPQMLLAAAGLCALTLAAVRWGQATLRAPAHTEDAHG